MGACYGVTHEKARVNTSHYPLNTLCVLACFFSTWSRRMSSLLLSKRKNIVTTRATY